MSDVAQILIGLFTLIASAAISYGVTKGKVNGLADRMKNMESSKYITREEYEARHKELVEIFRAFVKP